MEGEPDVVAELLVIVAGCGVAAITGIVLYKIMEVLLWRA